MAVTNRTLWLLAELRDQVGGATDDVVRDLTAAWVTAWDEVSQAWADAVAEIIAEFLATGIWPAPWKLARLSRLNTTAVRTQQTLNALTTTTVASAGAGVDQVIAATIAAEPAIMASQLPAQLAAAALTAYADNIVPTALEAIALRARQQITVTTWPLSAEATEAVRRSLIRGVATGAHPTDAARDMLRRVEGDFNGGLNRAIVVARTEMLDAYRDASAHVHQVNEDVLAGWVWSSTLDRRTCFPAGTWIATRAGQVPIEAVRVGDEVLAHTGGWRRVYETLDQPYDGPMVTVEAGPLRVTATADHPFLIERQGQLQWVEAQHIRRGDSVLSDRESGPHGVDHAGGEGAVERGSDEPDNGPAEALHVEGLAGVTVGDLGVPVRLVDLEGGPSVDEEVNRTLPAGDGILLLVGDAQGVQRAADIALGHGLAGVPSVAADRAEPGRAVLLGLDAERIAACEAVDHDGGSAADLRAVGVVGPLGDENGAASGARAPVDVGACAVDRAVVVPVGVAARDAERSAAARAGLVDLGRGGGGIAGPRAVDAGSFPAGSEGGAASDTLTVDARDGGDAVAGMGALPLVGGVTGATAELPPTSPCPRRGDLVGSPTSGTDPVLSGVVVELGAVSVGARDGAVFELPVSTVELGPAPLTSKLHRYTVSMVVPHVQAARVYNLEVEIDHSYVANGFAVHNCPACWGMHGTVHPLSVPGPEGHQQCRCARLPKAKTWRDLGIDLDEDDDLTPDAQQRFDGLDEAEQRAIVGPGRLAMMKAGKISLADLPVRKTNPGWRPSYVPRNLTQLDLLARRRRAQ